MAWFDDPSKELNRLNQRLLEEEEPEEEYLEEIDEEDVIPGFPNANKGYGGIRNFANGYRGQDLLDEEEEDWEGNDDEPYAVFYETRRERRHRLRKEKKERTQKRNSTLRLKVIILVESLLILGILIWWVMNQWPL